MGYSVMTLFNSTEIDPEMIDDESDFFYDEENFYGSCEDVVEENDAD